MPVRADVRPDLPFVFPDDGDVIVEDEVLVFDSFQTNSGTQEILEYTLGKAPIIEIQEVTGQLDNDTNHVFTEGDDYELSNDSERIVWQAAGDTPNVDTEFFVTYRAESILKRYIDESEDEAELTQDALIEVIESKFLSQAQGRELDEIGDLFGTIGNRGNRSDDDYRSFLGSIVQSFVSRGTVNGIKLSIATASLYDVEEITINEDFQNNSYEIVLVPDREINIAALNEIAEIADPSGVAFEGLVYNETATVEFDARATAQTLAGGDLGTSTLGTEKLGNSKMGTGTLDSGRLG